tara:strand:- start:277 stop:447 length:171 start_codon:yes stop_codon:yes gene_type:complete
MKDKEPDELDIIIKTMLGSSKNLNKKELAENIARLKALPMQPPIIKDLIQKLQQLM